MKDKTAFVEIDKDTLETKDYQGEVSERLHWSKEDKDRSL
jgi:hypothetical protein